MASPPVFPVVMCGAPVSEVGGAQVGGGVQGASLWTSADVFTNHGAYMPRTHCMTTAGGEPDWFWIGLLVVATLGVIALYARIYRFWRQCYYAEREEDRNPRMMDLANIFFWCAICGYVMSIVMFVWPAYRLLAIFLLVLNVWSWRFVWRIGDFRSALQAKRFERELRESLESRNVELERSVAIRTAELEEAQLAAVEASASKSRFLARMSHEIRTPLNSILGFVDVLEGGDGDDPALRSEHLDTIQRNGEHLLKVISDVLDLSKIEAGQMDVERIETDLSALLLDVHAIMQERAAAKGNTLVIELATPVPATITSDPTRLRQVLINLIGNASKFTERGSIRLVVSIDDRKMLRLDVIDTGIGLSAEEAEQLFQPFVQADGSTTRRFGGTGLGLTIARQLAERMGGSLGASGAQGEGAQFSVTIDPGDLDGVELITKLVKPRRVKKVVPKERIDARILLAEDGADNRRLITHLLKGTGIELLTVENGAFAVEEVMRHDARGLPFDAVLMDMQMPVMDGVTATRCLRDQGYGGPIIAVTANAMASDREHCLRSGCDDFLSKPVRREELIRTIIKHLNRNRRDAA